MERRSGHKKGHISKTKSSWRLKFGILIHQLIQNKIKLISIKFSLKCHTTELWRLFSLFWNTQPALWMMRQSENRKLCSDWCSQSRLTFRDLMMFFDISLRKRWSMLFNFYLSDRKFVSISYFEFYERPIQRCRSLSSKIIN